MAGLSGITVPGPVFIFIVQQAVVRGFKSGFIATIAHAFIGLIIIVLILITGVAVIFKSPAFELYMGLVGGLSLLILGLIILRNPSRHVSNLKLNARGVSMGPFIGGIIVSISNPAFFLWWLFLYLLRTNSVFLELRYQPQFNQKISSCKSFCFYYSKRETKKHNI